MGTEKCEGACARMEDCVVRSYRSLRAIVGEALLPGNNPLAAETGGCVVLMDHLRQWIDKCVFLWHASHAG